MIAINGFLGVYLGLYVLSAAVDLVAEIINLRHLRNQGQKIPKIFQSEINQTKLNKINTYTIEKSRLNIIKGCMDHILFLIIILSGLLPWLEKSLWGFSFLFAGLLFFALPGLAAGLVSIPFDYYRIFVIEENFGFNTRTLKIWLLDMLKASLVGLVLGGMILSGILIMVKYGGKIWWVWAWLIFSAFQVLVSILYPSVIAPIFNAFTPVEDTNLADKIQQLAAKEGLTLRGIYQMDATRRSHHTNAYLSGLGKAKRIVLFDSLIGSHEDDEILAVLSHEIGHLKRHHIAKQLIMIGITSFILLFLASKLMSWELMYRSFGFETAPLYAGLFLVAMLWQPIGFFFGPLAMALSRRYEREADRYSFKIQGTPVPLIKALKKMALDNLSNLRPHPLYVLLNYSHPPLVQRIGRLQRENLTGLK